MENLSPEDEEILKLYDEMKKTYGDKLPDPIHYPNVFRYYLKLYRWETKPS